jgi:citrate synthase
VLERIVAKDPGEREGAATAEVREYRARKRPVPGFGHPIHTGTDPRVERLVALTREAGAERGFIEAMYTLRDALRAELGKPLVMNISAAIAAALGEAGVPAAMMRGVVLTARCAGLVGHLFEEMNNPAAPALWEGAQGAVDYES